MPRATPADESIGVRRAPVGRAEPGSQKPEASVRFWPTRLWAADLPSSQGSLDNTLDFIAGGGRMGAFLRSQDWSATPLGAAEHWPRSLQNALRLMLAAPYPMSIVWGPDLWQFYNDASTQLLGANDRPYVFGPYALGLSTDIRSTVGPMIEDTVRHGQSRVVEDHLICLYRNECAEETYLTFRFDPIADDRGGIGGALVTVTDTTERVISRRRTAALRGLASAAAGAQSVEEACR